jgi:hypothetical protein
MQELTARLEKLERQTKRLRATLVVVVLAAFSTNRLDGAKIGRQAPDGRPAQARRQTRHAPSSR